MGDNNRFTLAEILDQARGFAFGVAAAIILSLAIEVQAELGGAEAPDWASVENLSLAALAGTAVRSAISFAVQWFTVRNLGGK